MKRKIIKIDRNKCDGCGLCVNACAEGAIQLVNGKAELVQDNYCDGLGACLGECPQDAIRIIEREAEEFDATAVAEHLKKGGKGIINDAGSAKPNVCPGMATFDFGGKEESPEPVASTVGELRQWPIQLHLVPVNAPYWQDADLLLAADCVPCAFGDFQRGLLRGRRLIIACPKLDETSSYVEKLAKILACNEVRSLTVAHMEVPCCTGIVRIAQDALTKSGRPIGLQSVKIGIKGELLEKEGDL